MLGALNAITHELVMVTNDTYITADSVCDLLRRIAKLNVGVPITLANAPARALYASLGMEAVEEYHYRTK